MLINEYLNFDLIGQTKKHNDLISNSNKGDNRETSQLLEKGAI